MDTHFYGCRHQPVPLPATNVIPSIIQGVGSDLWAMTYPRRIAMWWRTCDPWERRPLALPSTMREVSIRVWFLENMSRKSLIKWRTFRSARRHALREALLLLWRCLPNRRQLRRWTRSCGALYELPRLHTVRYGFVQRSRWIIHTTLGHCSFDTRTACPTGDLRKMSRVERRRSYFNVSY